MKTSPRRLLGLAAILGPVLFVLYLAIAVLFAPQMLLFPHHRQFQGISLYSEVPIPDAAFDVIERSNTLLSASALYVLAEPNRPIFLTEGGWRWTLLSLGAGDAFALSRPINELIIVNRSDLEAGLVWNGSTVAGERSLSGVIAHERTHTLIRQEFGMLADRTYPVWVREGYCDYVAQSSILSAEKAAKLRAIGSSIPALFYYDARQRVASALSTNGGSVRELFKASLNRREP